MVVVAASVEPFEQRSPGRVVASAEKESGLLASSTITGTPGTTTSQPPQQQQQQQQQQQSLYQASSFMSLLDEGPSPIPVRLYHERDLLQVMETITAGLSRNDDWQIRMKALSQLQGLACGDWAEFDASFLTSLRNIQELVSNLLVLICS